jgi:ubiquinone/menaquinone biosynthesis C-methylase UbiE
MTTEQTSVQRGTQAGAPRAYAQRDNAAFEGQLAARTVTHDAAFLLPYLHPGMELLDVGCGPGSITVGLAEAVAPGSVVGVDLQAAQVEQARALAAKRGVNNIRFEAADIFQLPFADASFDVVFANAVLMHLPDPVAALRELRRVLRPAGIIGVRDPDLETMIIAPLTPLMDQRGALMRRVQQHVGPNRFMGRDHRRLLLEAGFPRTEATASVDCGGSLEGTRRHAPFLKASLLGLARRALADGWVDQAAVDAMMAEVDTWAERPDAFYANTWCATIGWID